MTSNCRICTTYCLLLYFYFLNAAKCLACCSWAVQATVSDRTHNDNTLNKTGLTRPWRESTSCSSLKQQWSYACRVYSECETADLICPFSTTASAQERPWKAREGWVDGLNMILQDCIGSIKPYDTYSTV